MFGQLPDRKVMTLGRWVWAIACLALFGTVLALFAAMPPGLRKDPQLRDPQNLPVWSLLLDVMAIMVLALFAPLLVPPLIRLLTRPVPLAGGAVGLLARQNALTAVRRTVSMATPMFLVIGLMGTVVGSTLTFGEARAHQRARPVRRAGTGRPALETCTASRPRLDIWNWIGTAPSSSSRF